MHIQVTIISRLKAAMSEAIGKGRGKGGGVVIFFNLLCARFTSHPEQSGQKTLGKKILLPKCETVPEWTSPSREAVINSERLLLHQAIWLRCKEFSSCCWAKIRVGSQSPQRHYSLANVIAPFFFFGHYCCAWILLYSSGSFLCCPLQKPVWLRFPLSLKTAPSCNCRRGANIILIPKSASIY